MRKKVFFLGVFLIISVIFTGCGSNYDKAGRKSFAAGDYEKAAQNFAAAAEGNPNRAEYRIDYGLALTALGKYEEAVSQFELAFMGKDLLIVRENDKRSLRGKGIAYFKLKKYDKAVKTFEAALKMDELSELDMDILYYEAASLANTGAYDKAVSVYSAILSINSKSADAYSKRAACYLYLNDLEKSLADYDKAISLKPKSFDYYFGKYYLMSEMGDDEGAAAVLEAAAEIRAVSKEDKYNLAKLHYLEGQYDTALAGLNESLADGLAESNYYIGEINRIKKDYEQAVYCYESYIASGTVSSPDVYNQVAVCLMKLGKYKEALDNLELGLAYGNPLADRALLKNEIIALEYLGRFTEAEQKVLEYLSADPDNLQMQKEADFITTRISAQDTVN